MRNPLSAIDPNCLEQPLYRYNCNCLFNMPRRFGVTYRHANNPSFIQRCQRNDKRISISINFSSIFRYN
ncbi:hypothetical protein ANTRET_LOCUS4425 [Anthophora retusa]